MATQVCVPPPAATSKVRECRRLFESDRQQNTYEVSLPDALTRKYPKAPYEWRWQFVFSSNQYSTDPRSGRTRRHHLHEIRMQRAVKRGFRVWRVAEQGYGRVQDAGSSVLTYVALPSPGP